jgi:hypothetical protein
MQLIVIKGMTIEETINSFRTDNGETVFQMLVLKEDAVQRS